MRDVSKRDASKRDVSKRDASKRDAERGKQERWEEIDMDSGSDSSNSGDTGRDGRVSGGVND